MHTLGDGTKSPPGSKGPQVQSILVHESPTSSMGRQGTARQGVRGCRSFLPHSSGCSMLAQLCTGGSLRFSIVVHPCRGSQPLVCQVWHTCTAALKSWGPPACASSRNPPLHQLDLQLVILAIEEVLNISKLGLAQQLVILLRHILVEHLHGFAIAEWPCLLEVSCKYTLWHELQAVLGPADCTHQATCLCMWCATDARLVHSTSSTMSARDMRAAHWCHASSRLSHLTCI